MSSARPTPINDDHGDQFPGAVPPRVRTRTPHRPGAEQRLVRMRAARTPGGRPPGPAATPLTQMGRLTRRSLDRFDRYTLEVFNPASPHRPQARADRSD